MDTKLSIIIPTHNSGQYINNCLESILNQDFIGFEIIVIDGGSTDNTISLIKSKKDKRVRIISEPDKGIYDALNKGIKLSTGNWLYFLGSDDTLYPKSLSKLFSNNIDEFDFIYGDVIMNSSNNIYDGKFDLIKLFSKNICHQAIFTKRSLYEKIGLFNISYKVLADYAFNIQVFALGYKIKYLPIIIARFNEGGLSSYHFDLTFWRDYKTNILYPFQEIIPNKRLYNKLWHYFYYILSRPKSKFEALKLLWIISINDFNPKNTLSGLKHFVIALLK